MQLNTNKSVNYLLNKFQKLEKTIIETNFVL